MNSEKFEKAKTRLSGFIYAQNRFKTFILTDTNAKVAEDEIFTFLDSKIIDAAKELVAATLDVEKLEVKTLKVELSPNLSFIEKGTKND